MQLLIIGLATGLLPACFSSGVPRNPVAKNGNEEPAPQFGSQQRVLLPYGPPRSQPASGYGGRPLAERVPLAERTRPSASVEPAEPVPDDRVVRADSSVRVAQGDDAAMRVLTAQYGNEPKEKPRLLLTRPLTDEPALVSALKACLANRHDEALRHLNGLGTENQEILLNLLPVTAWVAQSNLAQTDPREVAVVVDQLQGLLLTLRAKAALTMDKLCFCERARKFGAYEAREPNPKYRPGDFAEIYFEIRNVSCNRSPASPPEFRTHTATALEIRDQTGGFVWKKSFSKPDPSLTARHDYFDHFRFQVPQLPGVYTLSVDVTDVPTGRKVKQKLEFLVRAE